MRAKKRFLFFLMSAKKTSVSKRMMRWMARACGLKMKYWLSVGGLPKYSRSSSNCAPFMPRIY
nr:MAG: hypothetical protein [Molluscum contagiosum virus]